MVLLEHVGLWVLVEIAKIANASDLPFIFSPCSLIPLTLSSPIQSFRDCQVTGASACLLSLASHVYHSLTAVLAQPESLANPSWHPRSSLLWSHSPAACLVVTVVLCPHKTPTIHPFCTVPLTLHVPAMSCGLTELA